MSTPWELPTFLTVGGEEWKIRTDFRAVLDSIEHFGDPEYEIDEQWFVCLDILYEDFDIDNPPPENIIAEMQKQAIEFIDAGIKDDGRKKPRMIDWFKDAPIMAAPISKVLGKDVRNPEPIHWWTFLAAYMESGGENSVWTNVLNIRNKLAKGIPQSKWEKHEREFYRDNRAIIDLEYKKPERSAEEKAALDELFGRK